MFRVLFDVVLLSFTCSQFLSLPAFRYLSPAYRFLFRVIRLLFRPPWAKQQTADPHHVAAVFNSDFIVATHAHG